jgi:hypothetical protein
MEMVEKIRNFLRHYFLDKMRVTGNRFIPGVRIEVKDDQEPEDESLPKCTADKNPGTGSTHNSEPANSGSGILTKIRDRSYEACFRP